MAKKKLYVYDASQDKKVYFDNSEDAERFQVKLHGVTFGKTDPEYLKKVSKKFKGFPEF